MGPIEIRTKQICVSKLRASKVSVRQIGVSQHCAAETTGLIRCWQSGAARSLPILNLTAPKRLFVESLDRRLPRLPCHSQRHSPSGFAGTLGAGGDIFFANRVDDAFAVVDAGAPGIDVYHENRPVARTDGSGKAIVPSLNSYQPNKISIDPRDLPLDASITTTQEILVPTNRSGVLADFGIKTNVRSAIVIFEGPAGQPLSAGLRGKTASGRSFVVGYDGRAFIEGLDPDNAVTVELPGGDCRAEFTYAPNGNGQVLIGPVVCK